MMFGNPSIFAIESSITRAYERLGQRALGFFVIHIMGRCYGVKSPDATMLANSFDEVGTRIAERGRHNASFATDAHAGEIAIAVRRALYTDCGDDELFFGMSTPQFANTIYRNHLLWAPDGDEAFDDGSYVLQFDVKDQVRLIAFSSQDSLCDLASVRDVWLTDDNFYGIIQNWHTSFEPNGHRSLRYLAKPPRRAQSKSGLYDLSLAY